MSKEKKLLSLKGKRIALVSSVPFFLVNQLYEQILYLSNLGMHITVVTSPGHELEKLESINNIKIHELEISRKINVYKDLVALLKLFCFFRKNTFDIIHSTTPKGGLLTMLSTVFLKCIKIHTYTGQVWQTKTGLSRYILKSCDKLISFLSTICYTDSDSQLQYLVKEGIAKKHKISLYSSGSIAGVNLSIFNLETIKNTTEALKFKQQFNEDSFLIVYIGRMTIEKGIMECLEAFDKLVSQNPSVELILIGPDEQNIILDCINKQKNINKIHYFGYKDNPENYLACCDLLCLPSYREGFGTVVIEAAALKIPTIGTQITGLKDAIVHGETGVLVKPRDVDDLYNNLIELSNQPDKVRKMGEKAYERCVRLYESNIVNRQLALEYSNLFQ